jgi:tellurite methyltransferase
MKNRDGVASFLVDNIALLPRGWALDVAMGNGRNSVYLAGVGFDVDGVDISPERIASARALAESKGVNINAWVADLEDGYRIEKNIYDVIVCINYLYRPLIAQIKGALKKGGMVLYETYLVDQSKWGPPKNPEHLLKHNELLELFCDFRCLRYREGVIRPRYAIASIVAEKT